MVVIGVMVVFVLFVIVGYDLLLCIMSGNRMIVMMMNVIMVVWGLNFVVLMLMWW